MFPPNVKRAQTRSFITCVEYPVRPKVSHSNHSKFICLVFCFCFLHQTGSSKSLLIRKTKTEKCSVKWNKQEKLKQSTSEEQCKKLTRHKPHQTLIPFNCLLHALRKPRTSGLRAAMLWDSSSGPLLWQIHAHISTHTIDPGRSTHACTDG
jgi:hypothetical protein